MNKKILFLCTHNSCRSQMAEGIVNQLPRRPAASLFRRVRDEIRHKLLEYFKSA